MSVIVHVGNKKIELGEVSLSEVNKIISVFEHIKNILQESDEQLRTLEEEENVALRKQLPDENVSSNIKDDHEKYKRILECPNVNCRYSKIYRDKEDGTMRRRCQYWHDSKDCMLGSRWCPNIYECGKVHGCPRNACDYGIHGDRYNPDKLCQKLFSCPFYHSTEEYDDWINAGLLIEWSYDPTSYL